MFVMFKRSSSSMIPVDIIFFLLSGFQVDPKKSFPRPKLGEGQSKVSVDYSFLGVSALCDRLRYVSSFDTKSAPHISRKPLNLESPHFTKTSTQTVSIASLAGYDVIIYF